MSNISDSFEAELVKRAEWLKKEAHNGGDWEHLQTRKRECEYVLGMFKKWFDEHQETLSEIEEFLDQQADCDIDAQGEHPNEAMSLLCKVREAMGKKHLE